MQKEDGNTKLKGYATLQIEGKIYWSELVSPYYLLISLE